MVQISKKLVVKKEVPIANNKELGESLDVALAEYYCKNKDFEKGLDLYRKIIPQIEEPYRKKAVNDFIEYSLNYSGVLFKKQNWAEAVEIYKELMKYPNFPLAVYKNIGICMKLMGNADIAIKFLKQFEELSPEKEDVYVYLADITYEDIKDNLKAIEYYEKALKTNKNNYAIYNMLGHLYSTEYQDKYKDKQLEYLTKAYELAPQNRIVVKNLAYVLGKFHETQKADEYYAKLMYLNPTHSDLHSYGAYLIQHRRFAEGFKFLQHRFQKEDLKQSSFPEIFNNKKKRWSLKADIKGKHVLVHYEQGFGDSIMFVRFVEQLKALCGKVSVVVQDGLIELFKDSDLGVEIFSEKDVENLKYDYYIPMMDLPIVCETTPLTIPLSKGYLKVPSAAVKDYGKKYIHDDKKFKIGIAYEGTLASKETDRDIPLQFLYPLMQLPGVEVYSFQVDDLTRQMDRVPAEYNFTRLGHTFKNWKDTAAAMKNMDLIVTTDNGVMNLAGALGVKTFGLFNTITEWRWFQTTGDDIVWYKSIKPFQCPTSKAWDVPVGEVVKEVLKLTKDKESPKKNSKTSKKAEPQHAAKKVTKKTSAKKSARSV